MPKLIRRAARVLDRCAGMGLVWTHLYGIPKPSDPATVKSSANLEWELLSPKNLHILSEIGWFNENERMQRLRRGDLCYIASCEGRLVHCSWVQRSGTHSITEAGLSVPVQNGEFWVYNCLTVERARGNWIYPEALTRIVNDHFSAGYETAWIYTSRKNISSQKGILRAGFGRIATLRALRVGSYYFCLDPPNPGEQFPQMERATTPISAPLQSPISAQTNPTAAPSETGASAAVMAEEKPLVRVAAAAAAQTLPRTRHARPNLKS